MIAYSKKFESHRGCSKKWAMKAGTFLKVIKNNSHMDVSRAKIVVGAGGNPDCEAE